MKISELFLKLKEDNVQKKIADPIKNAISAYQKVMSDDEVLHVFVNWEEVLKKLSEYFDGNPFTMRNYVTAFRDLSKMQSIQDGFTEIAGLTARPGEVEDQWERLCGEIEKARASFVKQANETSRSRRKERDSTISSSAGASVSMETLEDIDPGNLDSADDAHTLDVREQDVRVCALEEQVSKLKEDVVRVEQRWKEALKCVMIAFNDC